MHKPYTYSKVDDFLKKTCLFFFKALFCNLIRDMLRKRKGMRKITFGTIRAYVSKDRIGEEWLLNLMNLKDTTFE